MQQQDTNIYGTLYDIVAQNAKAAETSLCIPRAAFTLSAAQHPNCIALDRFKECDIPEYAYVLFWTLFNRAPDSANRNAWQEDANRLTPTQFKRRVKRILCGSLEARIRGVRAISHVTWKLDDVDCLSNQHEFRFSQRLLNILYRIEDWGISMIYRVYRVTLGPIRRKIREKKHAGKTERKI